MIKIFWVREYIETQSQHFSEYELYSLIASTIFKNRSMYMCKVDHPFSLWQHFAQNADPQIPSHPPPEIWIRWIWKYPDICIFTLCIF